MMFSNNPDHHQKKRIYGLFYNMYDSKNYRLFIQVEDHKRVLMRVVDLQGLALEMKEYDP